MWNEGYKSCLVQKLLDKQKQYIQITNERKSDLQNSTCGVPLGSTLFLVYVNDPPTSYLIMFADDTNLLYEPKNIIKRFATVNEELINTNY